MTESPVETLEKAIDLHLFWTEGLNANKSPSSQGYGLED